ncbi:winged helix-turn-helix transcriptional regulator [Pendulispora albinea]|uniref:Helix-turn-helix transcriptional regulator n=1 Tax=Pendulispora albinea TaxID=2741071 RepID=A0ABZ2LPP4_9BACT
MGKSANSDIQKGCPCLARDVLDRIGDRWSVLLVCILGEHEVLRFTELRRKVTGISQRMLTVTLRDLERDGFVQRKVKPVIPPHVEYRLTPLGHALLENMRSLVNWASRHQDAVRRAREAYDARHSVEEAG